MAAITSESVINAVQPLQAHWTQHYEPGEQAPVTGIYRCVGCTREIAANAGDVFPSHDQNALCGAKTQDLWQLNVRAQSS